MSEVEINSTMSRLLPVGSGLSPPLLLPLPCGHSSPSYWSSTTARNCSAPPWIKVALVWRETVHLLTSDMESIEEEDNISPSTLIFPATKG